MKEIFHRIAKTVAEAVGSAHAFVLAILLIIVWLILGPAFNFSTTWQLVINTTTTIFTFLIVFLIQNTQNRDSRAVHLKLDELIKASKGANDELIDLEDKTDEDLEKLERHYKLLGEQVAKHRVRQKP